MHQRPFPLPPNLHPNAPPHPHPLLLSPPQRNYRHFLLFIFSTTTLCCWVFALCLVQLADAAGNSSGDWSEAISDYPTAIVLMAYTFLAFW